MQTSTLRLILAAVAILAVAAPVGAAVGWTNGNMTIANFNMKPAAIGQYSVWSSGSVPLYAGVVSTYNSNTGVWSTLSGMPLPVLYGAAGAAGRRFLFAGGNVESTGDLTPAVQFYNIDTGVWTINQTALSHARRVGYVCSNQANTKIIFAAGIDNNDYVSNVDLFDGAHFSAVDVPVGTEIRREGSVAGPAGSDKCVIAGGRTLQGTYLATADIYTFSTGVYETVTNALALPRRYAASASFGTKFIVAGGRDNTGAASASIDVYDSATNSWAPFPVSLSVARQQLTGGTIGGLIFFAGGLTPSMTNAVDMYNISSGVMSLGQPLTISRGYPTAATVGTQFVIAGGYGDGENNYYATTDVLETSYCVGVTCQNGGTCSSGWSSYSCACAMYYSGPTCGTYTPPSTGGSNGNGGSTGQAIPSAAASIAPAAAASTILAYAAVLAFANRQFA